MEGISKDSCRILVHRNFSYINAYLVQRNRCSKIPMDCFPKPQYLLRIWIQTLDAARREYISMDPSNQLIIYI